MTNTPTCPYPNRDEALVDYLYGEDDGPARRAFAAHLDVCAPCRLEVEALGGVRLALTEWAPPEPNRALDPMPGVGPRLASSAAPAAHDRWRAVPVWAQAAAAVLCVGVAAGAANLRVRYDDRGLTVTTGWLQPGVTADAAERETAAAAGAIGAARWKAELTALEERLRGEMRQPPAAVPVVAGTTDGADDEALLRRVRTLVAQSEQRQQRELALRIGDVMNDMQTQRRADLSRIDRTIGLIQNNTGMEVLRQREMLNSLAVRVSGQR